MDRISQKIGIDGVSLVRALNFLPYPLLVSEFRGGEQHNIFVNKYFIDEIGYTCEDIPTIDAWFINAYPDVAYRESVISEWNELIIEAKARQNEFATKQAQIKTKFEGSKWFEVKASLFGSINLVVFVNIDEEIRREKKLELLNENKDRTLSILSHDLRSPLVNLHSVLQLVTNNSLNESEKTEILGKLTSQVFQVIEFLDTTLQWTRTNFSEQKSLRQNVDLQIIINHILSLYRSSIEEKKQTVLMRLNLEAPPLGDPEIFSILLRNLISNAIKYTPVSGEITISAKMDHSVCIIEVRNSGAAINAATIARILNKKYNSERGTQGEKGLGLGLRLCIQLLESLNGKMEIDAPSSNQTRFRILIPA